MNFFTEPDAALYLVDMPGYGFAEAPKDKVAAWNEVLRGYLAGRANLMRVFVLVDARHGVKAVDAEIMALLDAAAVSFQVVLTKADQVKKSELENTIAATRQALAKHPAAFPEVLVTSSRTGSGMPELRAAMIRLLRERI